MGRKKAVAPEAGQEAAPAEKKKRVSAKALMQKAYQKLDEKLDKGETTAIDGLVKLAKLEKDLDGEEKGAKEIKVRWEEKHESSSEG